MKTCMLGRLFFVAASMPLIINASSPAAMKDAEAKKIHAAIGKEVQKTFLDKKGGLLTKNLLKTPLSKSELSSWKSLFDKVQNYANKCGFARELPGDKDSSDRKAMLAKIPALNNDVLESLARINTIYKKFPKEAKKLTIGEIAFLIDRNLQLEDIFTDLVMNYSAANARMSKSQMMTDAALVLMRYVTALQDICNLTIKLLNEK